MRGHQENTSMLVGNARTLATYCYENKFDGREILVGMKVSCITNLYSKKGIDWHWRIVEGIVGEIKSEERQLFAPAVFLLNIQYSIAEDRSINAFHKCNEQFLSNCIRLCKSKFHFLHPKRYRFIKKARQWLALINERGISSWNSKNSTILGGSM